jgi:hypothetical protein
MRFSLFDAGDEPNQAGLAMDSNIAHRLAGGVEAGKGLIRPPHIHGDNSTVNCSSVLSAAADRC